MSHRKDLYKTISEAQAVLLFAIVSNILIGSLIE